jgi:hypothetical protein
VTAPAGAYVRALAPTTRKRRNGFSRSAKARWGKGAPLPPRLDRITFDELRDGLMAYYRTTGRWKHLDDAERRIGHLTRYFGGRRVVTITPR